LWNNIFRFDKRVSSFTRERDRLTAAYEAKKAMTADGVPGLIVKVCMWSRFFIFLDFTVVSWSDSFNKRRSYQYWYVWNP
jgi:hypothetical protein